MSGGAVVKRKDVLAWLRGGICMDTEVAEAIRQRDQIVRQDIYRRARDSTDRGLRALVDVLLDAGADELARSHDRREP